MANEVHTLTIGSNSYPIRPLCVETYTAKSGTDKPSTYPAGFSTNMVYNGSSTGWPYSYGNALTIKGLGTTQLMMSWNASQTSSLSAVPQYIYLRSQRDSAGDNWSDWTTIMTNDNAYTKTETDNKIAALVDSAPETLNTLNELAAALGDDPNFATTVANSLGGKANKNGNNATGTWGISITGAAGSSPIWSNVGSEILNSDFNNLGCYHGYFNKNAQSGITNNPATAGHIVSFASGSCPFQIATSYKSADGIYYRKYNSSGTTGWSGWKEFLTTAGGTLTGTLTTQTIAASANATYNIGADGTRFKDGYFSGAVYAAGGFQETSDERLKNFGDKIPVDLDRLSTLKKNYFNWKDGDNTNNQIGVSAQEVQKIYPELVNESEDGILSVAYNKLSVVALAAVDELHEKNKVLEDRIAKLEAIVNKLIDNE